MRTGAIASSPTLPEIDESTPSQDALPELDRKLATRRIAVDIAAGVRAWGNGKAMAFASLVGVGEGFISRVVNGKQSPPLYFVDAFRGDAPSTLAFTSSLLHDVGHIAVPSVTEIELTPEQMQWLLEMREACGPAVFEVVLARVAVRHYRCEPAMLAFAFESQLRMGK